MARVALSGAAHRALQDGDANRVETAEAFTGEVVGETPSLDGTRVALARFETDAIPAETTGTIEATSFWAGESAGGVKRVQLAAEIVRELAEDAERLLRREERV